MSDLVNGTCELSPSDCTELNVSQSLLAFAELSEYFVLRVANRCLYKSSSSREIISDRTGFEMKCLASCLGLAVGFDS